MKIQLVSQNLRFRHGVYEVIEVRRLGGKFIRIDKDDLNEFIEQLKSK